MAKKTIKNYVYTFDKADDYIYSDIYYIIDNIHII